MLIEDVLDAVTAMKGTRDERHPEGDEAKPGKHPGMRGNTLKGGGADSQPAKSKNTKGSGAAPGRPVSLKRTLEGVDARTHQWFATRPKRDTSKANSARRKNTVAPSS